MSVSRVVRPTVYLLLSAELEVSGRIATDAEKHRTFMLPSMSFLTVENATDPKRSKTFSSASGLPHSCYPLPNNVMVDSAASKNSVVEMLLSDLSTGTSRKFLLRVSKKVPPGGIFGPDMAGVFWKVVLRD